VAPTIPSFKLLISMTPQTLPDCRTFEHMEGSAHHGNVVAPKVGRAGTARLVKHDWRIACRSTKFFLTINLVLVTVIAVELSVGSDSGPSASAVPNVNVDSWPELSLTDLRLPSGELFDAISNRPLFEPSRRPHVPQIEPSLGSESEYLAIELIGTFRRDARWAALVKIDPQENAVWVRERGYISSWHVEKISADRLHLRRMGELRIVELWSKPESPPR
jgi:hypothetical protein